MLHGDDEGLYRLRNGESTIAGVAPAGLGKVMLLFSGFGVQFRVLMVCLGKGGLGGARVVETNVGLVARNEMGSA